ncbi:MAG: DUF3499 domain-containing protein [bacterium]
MAARRRCSRPSCDRQAISTLTYVYADSVAVLGPLATAPEPHSYDLCEVHAQRLTAPRGWELVRLEIEPAGLGPSNDDLEALANAVREAGRGPLGRDDAPDTLFDEDDRLPGAVGAEGLRRHLWALPSAAADGARRSGAPPEA